MTAQFTVSYLSNNGTKIDSTTTAVGPGLYCSEGVILSPGWWQVRTYLSHNLIDNERGIFAISVGRRIAAAPAEVTAAPGAPPCGDAADG